MWQNSTVILSETSQPGGNIGPNLSSNSNKCLLSQAYRRSILSSQAVSWDSWNRWQYSASWRPINHFNKSRLKKYKKQCDITLRARITSFICRTSYKTNRITVHQNKVLTRISEWSNWGMQKITHGTSPKVIKSRRVRSARHRRDLIICINILLWKPLGKKPIRRLRSTCVRLGGVKKTCLVPRVLSWLQICHDLTYITDVLLSMLTFVSDNIITN